MPIGDTIIAVANAIGDVSKAVTKSLPSEQQQLDAFKIRSPKIYARIMEHLYQKDKRFLRWHWKADIDEHVDLINSDLPDNLRRFMKDNLHKELGR